MDPRISDWLDTLIDTLAQARAVMACYGIDNPLLAASIEAALSEAHSLKQCAERS